jgi:hypothetical protein
MTPADGWSEAWFPFVVWRPCRILLGGPGEASAMGLTDEQADSIRRANKGFLSEAKCREVTHPERLSLHRRTTWGRRCRKWQTLDERGTPETAFLEKFCRELLTGEH